MSQRYSLASADIVFSDTVAGVLLMADRTNKSIDVVDLNLVGLPVNPETRTRQFMYTPSR